MTAPATKRPPATNTERLRNSGSEHESASYAPGASDVEREHWGGERRTIEAVPAVPLRWPTTPSERRAAYRTWRRLAMQVLHRSRVGFRLMAIIPEYLNQASGTFWPTNFTLAWEGGECDERTIKREVAQYRDLGLLIVELGWRRTPAGLKRTRTLRLALPAQMDPDIRIHDDDHGDNSGPYDGDDHGDNSGPRVGDNSGPVTFERTFEKKEPGREAA